MMREQSMWMNQWNQGRRQKEAEGHTARVDTISTPHCTSKIKFIDMFRGHSQLRVRHSHTLSLVSHRFLANPAAAPLTTHQTSLNAQRQCCSATPCLLTFACVCIYMWNAFPEYYLSSYSPRGPRNQSTNTSMPRTRCESLSLLYLCCNWN